MALRETTTKSKHKKVSIWCVCVSASTMLLSLSLSVCFIILPYGGLGACIFLCLVCVRHCLIFSLIEFDRQLAPRDTFIGKHALCMRFANSVVTFTRTLSYPIAHTHTNTDMWSNSDWIVTLPLCRPLSIFGSVTAVARRQNSQIVKTFSRHSQHKLSVHSFYFTRGVLNL